jgi:2-alkyl-3-oxoalkanoate reductase
MTKRIAAVAGASGLTGAALVSRLRERGYAVRVLSRSAARSSVPAGSEAIIGDLADRAALDRLCHGARLVFNTAGHVDDWGLRDQFWSVNADGAERLARAALDAGVERLVHLSTVDVFGFGERHGRLDERSPQRGERHAYSESKLEGERRVRALREEGLALTVIYPTWIFGPGDRHFLPEIIKALRGGTAQIDRGRPHLEMTFSENLADACILAAEHPGAEGEGFIVGDGYGLSLGQFLESVSAKLGVEAPRRSVPYGVAYALASITELGARLFAPKKRPPVTRYAVKTLCNGAHYGLSKIQALGYRPRVGFEEALELSLRRWDSTTSA